MLGKNKNQKFMILKEWRKKKRHLLFTECQLIKNKRHGETSHFLTHSAIDYDKDDQRIFR